MNRRTLVVATVVALLTASAHATDPARSREAALPPLDERSREATSSMDQRPLELRALFEQAPGVTTEDENGITAGPMQVNVLVARIDAGGKLVTACVDNEESARKFLQAPVEKLEGRKAKEH